MAVRFQCSCGEWFNSERGLQTHRGRQRHWGDVTGELDAELELVECPRCGLLFDGDEAARVHFRRQHGAPKPQPEDRRPRERVTADRLRSGDLVEAGDVGLLELADVRVLSDRVRLLSHGRPWFVPLETQFRRVVQSRRIDMRPDLRGGSR